MFQKFSIVSVIMMTTLGCLVFNSLCAEARMVSTDDHHDHSHNTTATHSTHHSTTNSTTAKNTTATADDKLIFVGEGKEGTPSGVGPSGNSTSKNDSSRGEKQYYVPYPLSVNPYGPFAGAAAPAAPAASPYYNPYPDYYAASVLRASGAGVTGPGNLASSCAYAYPNRRYTCLGQGRKK